MAALHRPSAPENLKKHLKIVEQKKTEEDAEKRKSKREVF
jgi:hypothetical protein